MAGMVVPPMYPKRTKLGDINFELTGNDYAAVLASDDPSSLMNVKAGAGYEAEQVLLKNALIDKYWWSEIGFDVDEQFTVKFQARWAVYANLYAKNIRILTNDFIYDRIKSSNKSTELGTGYLLGQHTKADSKDVDDSTQKTGTEATGIQKNFGANVQESENGTDVNVKYDNTRTRDNTTQQDTRRDNFGEDTEKATETTTYYDIEKIREIPQAFVLLEDFVARFKSLFMQVYTEL